MMTYVSKICACLTLWPLRILVETLSPVPYSESSFGDKCTVLKYNAQADRRSYRSDGHHSVHALGICITGRSTASRQLSVVRLVDSSHGTSMRVNPGPVRVVYDISLHLKCTNLSKGPKLVRHIARSKGGVPSSHHSCNLYCSPDALYLQQLPYFPPCTSRLYRSRDAKRADGFNQNVRWY